MNKIFLKLNQFNAPSDLHEKIMKSVFFLKYAKIFYATVFILFLNFINSLWFTYDKFIQNETFQALKDMSYGFDWSFDSIWDMVSMTISTLSLSTIFICAVSAIFFGYIFYFTYKLREISNHYSNNNLSGRIYD